VILLFMSGRVNQKYALGPDQVCWFQNLRPQNQDPQDFELRTSKPTGF